MTTILIVSKLGAIKELKVKNLTRDILHKKCNFKNDKNFKKQTKWDVKLNNEKYQIELWGKENGRAGSENKYDFPPPVDKLLLFGNCALIRTDDSDNLMDLKKPNWKKIYEKLFGGFDDLDDNEEESEDELKNVPKEMKSKDGYLLDGFIVDDSEEDADNVIISNEDDSDDNIDDVEQEEEDEEEDGEDDEEEDEEEDEDDSDYTDSDDGIGSELSEEDYDYSDDE